MQITMKAARVNAGFTQQDLAKMMKVSNVTILNWEKGKIDPKPAQLAMFCQLCGCSTDDILMPKKLA